MSNAVTSSTALSRITTANLVMATGTAVDEYGYSTDPGFNTHACEGRSVEQTPPPGTLVAKNTTVIVTFDIVRTPADFEIYELYPLGTDPAPNAPTEFPVFTFTQSPDNGGLCFDATPAYEGRIRKIDPLPQQLLPLTGSIYEIKYWLATTVAGPPDCPAYTPPP